MVSGEAAQFKILKNMMWITCFTLWQRVVYNVMQVGSSGKSNNLIHYGLKGKKSN